ncbi:MAG: Gfo/Idh/MocA family oxidoreductase [Actinobacteria bacterium]|nr:Gfo/Idh/MocA family oxidoreductase [Actinomycetota bacterium]
MTTAVETRPRLGFVGAGWIGRHRLDAIAASGIAEIAGVADPAVEGCLRSFDELLELARDGVVVATPTALHAEQAITALERGLPVFCQKPLGRNAAETRRVVEAARAADRLLAVDLSYRFTAAARALRDEVLAGRLGRVVAADLTFHNAYGPDRQWFYSRELAGGGCLIDLGVHLVDLALWILGFQRAQVRSAWLRTPPGREVEELAFAELEVGEALVRIACSWNLHAGRDAQIVAAFYGPDGAAALRNVGGSFYDLRAERFSGTTSETLVVPPDDWGGRAAVEWARRVVAGERYDPEAERLVVVAELLDAIYREAT